MSTGHRRPKLKLRLENLDGTPRERAYVFTAASLNSEIERVVKRAARKMAEGREGEVRGIDMRIEPAFVFPAEWLPRVEVFLATLMLEENGEEPKLLHM